MVYKVVRCYFNGRTEQTYTSNILENKKVFPPGVKKGQKRLLPVRIARLKADSFVKKLKDMNKKRPVIERTLSPIKGKNSIKKKVEYE